MPKEQLVENDEQNLDDDDIEVIVEGEEAPEKEASEKQETKKGKGANSDTEDDKEASRSEDDEEDEDDGPTETEEEIRERRRKEKLVRKERKEKAMARDKLEMTFLRQRNEELEKRIRAQELRSDRQDHYTLEQQIEDAEERARMAEQVIAKAIAEANGDDATKAIKIRDEAIEKIRQLQLYRDKISQQSEQKQKEKSNSVDPLVVSYAQAWMSKNDWYDSQAKDIDSRIVLAIDQSLVEEGYVPKTAQYWRELDKRVRAKLPHRYDDDHSFDEDEDSSSTKRRTASKRSNPLERYAEDEDNYASPPTRAKKGPPVGQQSESGMGAKKKEIYISKDRKEALIQAGVWDDPVLRMRYVKRYQDWDKENASR
jgi:hypothetical protein